MVSKIAAVSAKPATPVVELLESLLADARAGKIQSAAIVYETENGKESTYAYAWSECNAQQLVGEMERLKLRLLLQMESAEG